MTDNEINELESLLVKLSREFCPIYFSYDAGCDGSCPFKDMKNHTCRINGILHIIEDVSCCWDGA